MEYFLQCHALQLYKGYIHPSIHPKNLQSSLAPIILSTKNTKMIKSLKEQSLQGVEAGDGE